MKIARVPISGIKAAPYNPRQDLKPGDQAFEKIRQSIREFDSKFFEKIFSKPFYGLFS